MKKEAIMFGQIPFNPNQNMFFPNQMIPSMNNANNLEEINKKINEIEKRLTKIEKKLNIYPKSTEYDYQNSMYMM